MNNSIARLFLIAACLGGTANVSQAQVPNILNYQGRIVSNGTNFHGAGQFKFALVNAGASQTYWANSAGNPPAAAVTVGVSNGLYSVLLGDTTLANMAALPSSVFGNPDVRLRVWFNNGSTGFQQLAPDQRIAAVGYAMMAANVADGAITANKLAAGAVNASGLASGSITADKFAVGALSAALPSNLRVGSNGVCGRVDVYSTDIGTPGVTLDGCTSQISAFIQPNGIEGAELVALDSGGQLLLRDELAQLTVVASSAGTGGGGHLAAYNAGQRQTLFLDGHDANGAGLISVRNTNSSIRAEIKGQGRDNGGEISLRNDVGQTTFLVQAAELSAHGSQMSFFNGAGTNTIVIDAEYGDNLGGAIEMNQSNGTRTVTIKGDAGGDGGWMAIYNNLGERTIELDGKASDGLSRITTQVLEITGGADLSENFEINSHVAEPQPGMIVCIDPARPGHLLVSEQACDRTVAGIISGAGGIRPGMLMGQAGSKADGKHPVALTGRVYCWVDADAGGAIKPGDLITTSNTPGHGMKVGDSAQAAGAIIGKAMTSLSSGKGLVLILVSLQ